MGKKKVNVDEECIEFSSNYSVIGADLGLNRPGFCCIRLQKGSEFDTISSVITMSVDNKSKAKDMKKARGEKMTDIAIQFGDFIDHETKAGDQIFYVREQSINNAGFGKRSGTAARTGISETVGLMDYLLWSQCGNKSWDEYYPVTIKKQLTGNHKADKQQVADAVRQYVGDIAFANDDESDAVAVALAWLIKHGRIKQIAPKEEE